MLNAKNIPTSGNGGGDRPDPLESGTYPARLVQVILLGTQAQRPYKGQDKPPALELYLTYEFLDEFMKDEEGNDIEDKPRWLSERVPFYNLEIERAKSTKRYYALDPTGKYDGDWSKLLGAPVMVTVITAEGKGKNTGKVFNNIASTSAMREREAAKAPDLINPPKVFDFYEPDMEVFNSLPDWLKEVIKEAVDFGGSALEIAIQDGDEIPLDKPKGKTPKKEVIDDDEVEW